MTILFVFVSKNNVFSFSQSFKNVLNCPTSKNQLMSNQLSNEQLSQLEIVLMNNCSFNILPDDLFANSSNIQNITLTHNNLTEIPAMIFNHQINLLNLDLSFNEIMSLNDDIFRENINLVVLRLSYNRFSNISRYKQIVNIIFQKKKTRCLNGEILSRCHFSENDILWPDIKLFWQHFHS